jgi:hypothetical protein
MSEITIPITVDGEEDDGLDLLDFFGTDDPDEAISSAIYLVADLLRGIIDASEGAHQFVLVDSNAEAETIGALPLVCCPEHAVAMLQQAIVMLRRGKVHARRH